MQWRAGGRAQKLLKVNEEFTRYGFRDGTKAVRYGVKVTAFNKKLTAFFFFVSAILDFETEISFYYHSLPLLMYKPN